MSAADKKFVELLVSQRVKMNGGAEGVPNLWRVAARKTPVGESAARLIFMGMVLINFQIEP